MSDKVALTINLTQEAHQRLENLAHQHGYDNPGEYLLSLVEAAETQALEETKAELLEEFRQGWQAAMNGQTIPASELWDALNSDE